MSRQYRAHSHQPRPRHRAQRGQQQRVTPPILILPPSQGPTWRALRALLSTDPCLRPEVRADLLARIAAAGALYDAFVRDWRERQDASHAHGHR